MNDFNYNNEENQGIKKYLNASVVILIIIGLAFTCIGLYLAFFTDESNFIGGLFFAMISFPFAAIGIKNIILKIIYDKHPWCSERILLANHVIPIREEYREKLYDLYSIDSDEHDHYEAQQLEEMFKLDDGIDRYAVGFTMYGKLNRETFRVEDFNRIKMITTTHIYISKSNRFQENRLYACDVVKYGVDFYVNNYQEEDFELLG